MGNTKVTNSEPGIIGQMYEERKTGRKGVLESRESKYKTLMMRDDKGETFNIVYSTFRSNWRKYTGEEVIQTSTQVEEAKTEEKKRAEESKKVVESKSEVVKMTTEEKVKKVKALDDVVCNKIESLGLDLKTSRTHRGCVIVRYKKKTLFEIWTKFGLDKFDFVVLEDVVALSRDDFNKVINDSDYTYKKDWHLSHLCRVKDNQFDDILDTLLSMSGVYVTSKQENEKTKETKNEEE